MRSESKHSRDTDDDDKEAKVSTRADAKGESKGSSALTKADGEENIVQKVISYFFDDDDFANTFEKFAQKHCAVFDLDSDQDEMKLEYTDIYNKFQALFEEKLEEYIVSQGSSVKEFYGLIRQAYEEDKESSLALCSEILVATADFDVFVIMMKQTKESLLLAKK